MWLNVDVVCALRVQYRRRLSAYFCFIIEDFGYRNVSGLPI